MASIDVSNPSSASLCWQATWTFTSCPNTLFLSNFIGAPGLALEKAFRLGVETDAYGCLAKVCCYVNCVELARFGFMTKEVTCTLPDKSRTSLGALKSDDGQQGTRSYFLRAVNFKPTGKESSLTFRLHVSGLVTQYIPRRFDVHLGQELWKAAVDGKFTDVVFQVGGSTFPAHKFVLASRSPVFRAMFGTDMVESRTGEVQILDISPKLFGQFLRFIYSGQVMEPLSKQLGMVADKYQVKTLVGLCQAFIPIDAAVAGDGLEVITATCKRKLIRPPSGNIKTRRPDDSTSRHPSKADILYTTVYNALYAAPQNGNVTSLLAIGKFFRCKVNCEKGENQKSYEVALYSSWKNGLARRLEAVELHVLVGDTVRSEHSMEPLVPQQADDFYKLPLQTFHASGIKVIEQNRHHVQQNTSFGFILHFSSTLDSFQYQLRDSLFDEELWSSVINKEWTDVEYHVDGQIFPAHRAVIAARCPTLAALIPADDEPPSPSSPAIVRVSGVDPIVFEDILHFLYTGSTKDNTAQISQDLLDAAEAYKIETLSRVARASRQRQQEADLEKLSEFLMSSY